MNKQIEALKMAIVALESSGGKFFDKEINACKEALEQPAQEPVAWMYETDGGAVKLSCYREGHQGGGKIRNYNETPLYTHPAQPLNKTAERDYNFMRDLAIGAEELLSKTIKELDEVKELLAQRNLELIAARDMLLNKHME